MSGLRIRKKHKPSRPHINTPSVFASAASVSSSNPNQKMTAGSAAKGAMAARVAASTAKHARKAEEDKLALLAEDPNVFAYDEVFDDIQAERQHHYANKLSSKKSKKSKYIAKLQEQATRRKFEQEVIYGRGIIKEKNAEAEMFDDTEAFVTKGYQAKMEERKRWELEQKVKEKRDESHNVETKKNMSAFHTNLLHHNVAFGGSSRGERAHSLNVSANDVEQVSRLSSASKSSPRDSSPINDASKADDNLSLHTSHSFDRSSTVTQSGKESESTKKIINDAERKTSTSIISSSSSSSSTVSTVPRKTKENISDAKRRYLERKMKKLQEQQQQQ